jgi:hypothetical protein
MILCLRSSCKTILMLSSLEKSESSPILDLILFRPLSAWNLWKCQLVSLARSFPQITRCKSSAHLKNSFTKLSLSLLRSAKNTQHLKSIMSQVLSSGRRKYTAILEELLAKAFCRVECTHLDTRTIIDGVKKEKVKWVKRQRWPKGKALKIDIEANGVLFKSVLDTSINNL